MTQPPRGESQGGGDVALFITFVLINPELLAGFGWKGASAAESAGHKQAMTPQALFRSERPPFHPDPDHAAMRGVAQAIPPQAGSESSSGDPSQARAVRCVIFGHPSDPPSLCGNKVRGSSQIFSRPAMAGFISLSPGPRRNFCKK